MKSWILAAALSAWACLAFAQENGNDSQQPKPASDQAEAKQAADESESKTVAKAQPGEKEFKPPPGFKTKKHGKHVLYCIRDSTVGTRFKTEKCYNEEQMKAYLLAREQNNRDFDQRRAICSNPQACGMP